MKIDIGDGKTLAVKRKEKFRDIPRGSLFVLVKDEQEHPSIWVKTPMADMYKYNNEFSKHGAFCNAYCINAEGKNLYMQCDPKAECFVISTEDLFNVSDVCSQ